LLFRISLLITAVTVDGFAAAVTMGGCGIRIPVRSAAVLAFTGTAFLGVSVFFAERIGGFLPAQLLKVLSATLLSLLGVYNIAKSYLRRRYEEKLLQKGNSVIFLDECDSDTDRNKIISVREAVTLSVVLSADSLATGAASAPVTGEFFVPVLFTTFLTGLCLVVAGNKLGMKIAAAANVDFEKICGVILILLAVVNLR
jgi:putative sporulation protein YtaF